jgi:hypothetical protein
MRPSPNVFPVRVPIPVLVLVHDALFFADGYTWVAVVECPSLLFVYVNVYGLAANEGIRHSPLDPRPALCHPSKSYRFPDFEPLPAIRSRA